MMAMINGPHLDWTFLVLWTTQNILMHAHLLGGMTQGLYINGQLLYLLGCGCPWQFHIMTGKTAYSDNPWPRSILTWGQWNSFTKQWCRFAVEHHSPSNAVSPLFNFLPKRIIFLFLMGAHQITAVCDVFQYLPRANFRQNLKTRSQALSEHVGGKKKPAHFWCTKHTFITLNRWANCRHFCGKEQPSV